MQPRRKFHVYRIINSDLTHQKTYPKPQSQSFHNDMLQITQNILKNKKYIYLDLAAEFNVQLMEKQSNPETSDEQEGSKIGNSCITNLKYLSKNTNHMANYLNLVSMSEKKNDIIRQSIKTRLNKIKRTKELHHITNYETNSKKIENLDSKQLSIQKKLNQLSQQLTSKQQNLIKKFGIQKNFDFPQSKIQNKTIQSPRKLNITPINTSKTMKMRKNSQSGIIIKDKEDVQGESKAPTQPKSACDLQHNKQRVKVKIVKKKNSFV